MIKVIGSIPPIQSGISFDPIGSCRLKLDIAATFVDEMTELLKMTKKGTKTFVITFTPEESRFEYEEQKKENVADYNDIPIKYEGTD